MARVNVPGGLADVIAISANAGFHNLALHRDGRVSAWGRNDSGQASVPAGLTDVVAIGVGSHHSLAVHRASTPHMVLARPARRRVILEDISAVSLCAEQGRDERP
jgi:hypothetical protein